MLFIANLLATIGEVAATLGTQGSWVFIADEPKMPNSLIEK